MKSSLRFQWEKTLYSAYMTQERGPAKAQLLYRPHEMVYCFLKAESAERRVS